MRALFLLAALPLVTISPLLADTVFLRNGEQIDGVVVDHGSWIEIKVSSGSVWVMRRDVVRIVVGEAKWCYVHRLLKTTRSDDVETLKRLLSFCREHNLTKEKKMVENRLRLALRKVFERRFRRVRDESEALALEMWAYKEGLKEEAKRAAALRWHLHIKTEIEKIKQKDPQALIQLSFRLKAEGVPIVHLRLIYEMILQMSPDSVAARVGMGLVYFEGNWLTPDIVKEILARRYDQKMASAGFVYQNGKWVKPDTIAILKKEQLLCDWERRLVRRETSLREKEMLLREQERSLNSRAAYLHRWQRRLRCKEEELKNLQNRCERYTILIVELRNECGRYRSECSTLRRSLSRTRAELERLRRELQRLREENDSLRRRLKERSRRDGRRSFRRLSR